MGQHRSTQRQAPKVVDIEEAKLRRHREIAAEHIRWGRRMANRLLRREGWLLTHKRGHRLPQTWIAVAKAPAPGGSQQLIKPSGQTGGKAPQARSLAVGRAAIGQGYGSIHQSKSMSSSLAWVELRSTQVLK